MTNRKREAYKPGDYIKFKDGIISIVISCWAFMMVLMENRVEDLELFF